MHFIQSKILDKLLYAESARYSQLRPQGIESNHFAYHLKELIRDGMVTKLERGYTLAPKGLHYVDRLSHKHMKPREQPKIITMIKVTNLQGEELFFTRHYQPYIHRQGWPSGKVHLDETPQQAAKRELSEKTGLTGVKLHHRGIVGMTISTQGFSISELMIHLFEGKVSEASVLTSNERGSGQWQEADQLDAQQLMPGHHELAKLMARRDFFYEDLAVEF